MKSQSILFLLTPKQDTAYLKENATVMEALRSFYEGKTGTIPVVDEKGKYVGAVRKNSFLWMIAEYSWTAQDMETKTINSLVKRGFPCVSASAQMHEVMPLLRRQSIIPVVDDREMFIGILRRADAVPDETWEAQTEGT